MRLSNFGAVRLPLLAAAVLALFACPVSAQIVERSQTWDNLIATHPCNAGLNGRHTILTDAQSSSSIGGGGGSVRVFVECDGVDTWSIVSIGGGGGGSGDVVGPASATDNEVARYDSTTGKILQAGSLIGFLDATGATTANIKNVNGTTTFKNDALDPGFIDVGSQSWRDASANRVGIFYSGHFSVASDHRIGFADSTTEANNVDTSLVRSAAGIVGFTNATTGGGAIHLTPMASPPRTCDATAEGDIYSDTSHALCWCDASTWQKLSGAGTCA
jgi:hypothetical protein